MTFRRVLEDIFGPTMSADIRREIDDSALTLALCRPGRVESSRPIRTAARAADGRGGPRSADQLCERRQPVACAGRITPARYRSATGARHDRLRLVRQAITESLVLSSMGGGIGLLHSRGWAGRHSCGSSRRMVRACRLLPRLICGCDVRGGNLDRDRTPVRIGAGVAVGSRVARDVARRRGSGSGDRSNQVARPSAGRRAGGRVSRAGDGCRVVSAHVDESAQRRSRVRAGAAGRCST